MRFGPAGYRKLVRMRVCVSTCVGETHQDLTMLNINNPQHLEISKDQQKTKKNPAFQPAYAQGLSCAWKTRQLLHTQTAPRDSFVFRQRALAHVRTHATLPPSHQCTALSQCSTDERCNPSSPSPAASRTERSGTRSRGRNGRRGTGCPRRSLAGCRQMRTAE